MLVGMTDHTTDPERTIARCAAICYDSATDDAALERRIKSLMKMRHLATLRFAYATFRVSGISRACSHQLVRHPHLSYLQRSQRYCNDATADIVIPDSWDALQIPTAALGIIAQAFAMYDKLIEAGIPKGDARYILPQMTATEVYVTGNLQAWHDFLSKRLDKSAQWEIRAVAEAIHEQLVVIAPNVFGGLV